VLKQMGTLDPEFTDIFMINDLNELDENDQYNVCFQIHLSAAAQNLKLIRRHGFNRQMLTAQKTIGRE